MSLVGVTLKEKRRGGREYTVVGEDQGGYVLAPVAFGPNERVLPAELATRFGTEIDECQPVDEQEGWEALAAANEEAADRIARRDYDPPERTPEQRFGEIVHAGPDARRLGIKS